MIMAASYRDAVSIEGKKRIEGARDSLHEVKVNQDSYISVSESKFITIFYHIYFV